MKAKIAAMSPTDKAALKSALTAKVSKLTDADVAKLSGSKRTAPVEEEEPSTTTQVVSAAAGGAASGAVGNLLSEIEKLFRRDEMDMEKRKGSSVGSSIGGAVAGGAASAVVGNLLGEIESLFRRDGYVACLSLTCALILTSPISSAFPRALLPLTQ